MTDRDGKSPQPGRPRGGILGATLADTMWSSLAPRASPRPVIGAGGAPSPIGWEGASSEYRQSPSDAAFRQLVSTYQSPKKAVLSELVLSTATGKDAPMFVRHLAVALFVDSRLLEANHFADRWLALEPNDFDALNLKATICLERGELRAAADHFNKMGPMRAASIEVSRLRLMLYLRMDEVAAAREHAHEFLKFPDLGPTDILLVAETGVRACDHTLVRGVVLRRGKATYNQRGEHMLREVARLGLLQTLVARPGADR